VRTRSEAGHICSQLAHWRCDDETEAKQERLELRLLLRSRAVRSGTMVPLIELTPFQSRVCLLGCLRALWRGLLACAGCMEGGARLGPFEGEPSFTDKIL
jgi:hypothetical protein